jgi:hypothetical protein
MQEICGNTFNAIDLFDATGTIAETAPLVPDGTFNRKNGKKSDLPLN